MLMQIEKLIKKYDLKIDGVIHVGGHVGEEVGSYKKYTNNIHVFEPLMECYEQIPLGVEKYPFALGPREEVREIYVSNNKQSSSLLSPKNHLFKHPTVSFSEKRLISVKTLDSFEIKNCNFLNLDVQGFELEVLKGAEKTLDEIDSIYTEVNEIELYSNCVLIDTLDLWLKERKFERVEIVMSGDSGWGDAFYIKNW